MTRPLGHERPALRRWVAVALAAVGGLLAGCPEEGVLCGAGLTRCEAANALRWASGTRSMVASTSSSSPRGLRVLPSSSVSASARTRMTLRAWGSSFCTSARKPWSLRALVTTASTGM